MERVRRLAQFWNWLPAFRSVAESEHLPTAAQDLGISAPGLSRMIKLVESDLGQPLFERRARRLVLNEAGKLFLHHVRDAMRRVDDGLVALANKTFTGELKIAASNATSLTLVLPALESLALSHPDLTPELHTHDEAEICELLLTGKVDLALLEQSEVHKELEVEPLARMAYGIYCAPNHPLVSVSELKLSTCLDYAFVATAGVAGSEDAWPLNLRRRVALRVGALNLAMATCATGRLLALLPDAVASRYPAQLLRLEVGNLAERQVFLAHRPILGEADRVLVLKEALHAVP
ncbi:MAG: LysR family transcriptional regulator [Deltaproteobacteria bacterium]|nr:LysR family transcriptional regulator [Deltaproteobacteria bacterium]